MSPARSRLPDWARRAADRPGRYDAIDLARGVAAIAVLIWHYQHFIVGGLARGSRAAYPLYALLWPLYEQGGLAVQFFWMVSGFIFPAVYFGRKATTGQFVMHRFARLYPLHLLTLLVILVLQFESRARFGHDLIYPSHAPLQFVRQLAMASGWWLADSFTFNGPIWSVSAEVLVYLLFWMTLPWLFRRGPVLALLFAMAGFLLRPAPVAECAGYFFCGAALFDVHRRASPLAQALAAAPLFGLAAAAGFGFGSHGVAYLLAFGGLLLLLAAADDQGVGSLARRVPWIADNCYGSYLWHVPLQIALILVLGGVGLPIFYSPYFLLFFLVAVIVTARVSFLCYERPAREWIRKLADRRAAILNNPSGCPKS